MRAPRLSVVDRTDAPADLNGLIHFAERQNLVSAHVPTHFKRSLVPGVLKPLHSSAMSGTTSPVGQKTTTLKLGILGCSYRASSVRIAIRLPTDATVYIVYLFPLFLPYMFRALISPSSGVSQAVFYVQPFGSCVGQEITVL